MIDTNHNFINAYDIDEAWRDAIWLCVKNGYDYKIESSSYNKMGGSYVGQIRRQMEYVTIVIRKPGNRPLAPILPPNIPSPTDEEKITNYFIKYIIEDFVSENQEYTYGKYIKPQISKLIERLNLSRGNTNQACISIGDTNSINLEDPPCLRLIDFKVVDGKLNMTLFFRSWDLISAFPENLGGLQLLKEFVLNELTFPCEDGKIIAYSSGLHIYSQYFDFVKLLCYE